jgi:uncharacterized protein (TIGR02118 family)
VYCVMFVLYRKAGMSQDAFTAYWRDVHVPRVAALPGLRRYRIAPVAAADAADVPFSGIAELWFDTEADWRLALSSPEGQEALRDVDRFQDRSEGAHVMPTIVIDKAFGP